MQSGATGVSGFKLDENIPPEGAAIFLSAGHDCHTVYDEHLAGASDSLIVNACNLEQRILVTLDLDFSDVRRYPPGSHPGIIVLRAPRRTKHTILRLLIRISHLLQTQSVSGRLWIVDESRVRIR
jgi:predicted nuclease of predicted toxin-antitoxin system